MSVTKQLYQLQEVDLELERNEQALHRTASQLGESEAVTRARGKLAQEHQRLEELKRQQRSLEWEIGEGTSKLTTAEEELYSGRIRNPKELTSLQMEVDSLKTRRGQLEDRALEIMEQIELTTKNSAAIDSELKVLEADWKSNQQQLSAEVEQLKAKLSDLRHKRELLAAKIDPKLLEVYEAVKKQKSTAVAKVEQGICHGCRISLPTSELHQTRKGGLVRCSSCGRILFLA